jgi:TorA maturation chaperone TorD
MIDELKEELSLYNLLRQLFLKEPDKELLDGIAKIEVSFLEEDEIVYGFNLLINAIKKNHSRIDEWIEELALEYARLFIGPLNPPAVPYASFYLSESRSLMTEETIEVRKKYLEAGLAVKSSGIPDDHIGIELEFIYYLTKRIIELYEKEQKEEVSKLLSIRSDFLNNHVARWLPLFADRIINFAQEDFYQGLAYILKTSIA